MDLLLPPVTRAYLRSRVPLVSAETALQERVYYYYFVVVVVVVTFFFSFCLFIPVFHLAAAAASPLLYIIIIIIIYCYYYYYYYYTVKAAVAAAVGIVSEAGGGGGALLMAGVEGEGLLNEMSLHQELNGAKRLAEFRLQKVIELQDEVVRLRRLLLTMRGGSEVLQRANSSVSRGALSVLGVVHASEGPCARNGGANRQRNGGPSSSPHPKAPAAMQVKWEQEALVKATQKNQEKLLRRPSTSLSPRPASCVRKGSRDSCVSIPRQRASSSSSLLPANCSVSSSNCLDAARRVSAVSHSGTSRPVSPFVASTASQSWATTRPLIKLHTGVQLRGPKTFRRLPPPPVESLHEDEASFISAGGPTSLLSSPQQQQQQQQQQRVCTTVVIRREHDAVREALAMLRGISLRADRNMLSTLTTLSNRRGIDRALPSALAEFKQILLRAHPSLTGRLQDGEAWRIDEDQRDALEVVQVPGMAAALRDLVITYDYTACVYQQVLYQSDGAVCAQLGKAFHEFYANMYVLLALAQCPSTLR